MNSSYFSYVAAVMMVLAGCSSTPTHVDKGPLKARTFSFIGLGPRHVEFAENRKEVHAMIQDAITKHLAAKGLAKVEEGGEVTVAYLVIVGNNALTASVDEYFGYGRDSSELKDKAHTAYTSKNKNPNYFEAGTLLIDIIDSQSYALLNRSFATQPLLREVPSDVKAAQIQEIVDAVLADLRVAP